MLTFSEPSTIKCKFMGCSESQRLSVSGSSNAGRSSKISLISSRGWICFIKKGTALTITDYYECFSYFLNMIALLISSIFIVSFCLQVLVMFVVQRLEPHFPQASKTSIGHVVQLLYRASCFKVHIVLWGYIYCIVF